jgi:para-aminobenzoate synthetase
VRKSPTINTLEKAKALLDVQKEKAENLIIVDLVCYDLYSVYRRGNVSMPRLMVVEEYKSVLNNFGGEGVYTSSFLSRAVIAC